MNKALAAAEKQIKHHEGCRLLPYEDTAGLTTIGYGRCLDRKGISQDEAEYLFQNDLRECEEHCKQYPYWQFLNTERQAVLLGMRFNLGPKGYVEFKRMHSALDKLDYSTAADEIIDSEAYRTNNGLAKRYGDYAKAMRGDG